MAWVLTLTRAISPMERRSSGFTVPVNANIDQAMTLVSEEVRVFLGEMVDARYMPSQ